MFWGKIKEMSRIVRELPPDGINVPDGRVRRITYDDGLRSLADSIRDHGVIEPLIVRRIQSGEGEVTYTLVAGRGGFVRQSLRGLPPYRASPLMRVRRRPPRSRSSKICTGRT